MGSRLPAVVLSCTLAVWATGCAEPPTARVDAAKSGLAAVAAEATTYAPAAYKAAQDAAAQLDAELAEQGKGYFPSYDRAGQLAAALEDAVAKIPAAVAAGKERARAETSQMVTDTRTALAGAGTSIGAMTNRQAPADQRAAWTTAATGVEASLAEVDKLLAAGQLEEAKRQAEAAQKAAAEVTTAVAGVQAEIEAERAAAAERAAQGDATIAWTVMADGQPLRAGTYDLRLGDEVKTPAGGTERWVEFVRAGKVAGRALAVVVPDAELKAIAESAGPRNGAQVELLKGRDYVRVWLHRGGVNYLIHLPPQAR